MTLPVWLQCPAKVRRVHLHRPSAENLREFIVNRSTLLAVAAAGLVAAVACSPGADKKSDTSSKAAASPSSGGADLTGAGATFPQPIYTKWVSGFLAKT